MPDASERVAAMTNHDEIRARCAEAIERASKATAGPWHWYSYGQKSNDAVLGPATNYDGTVPPPGHYEKEVYDEDSGEYTELGDIDRAIATRENDAVFADFNFSAHARADVPDLAAACLALLDELAQLRRDAAGKGSGND